MKLYCPKCQLTFSVSDDKVPAGRGLRILCPKCRTLIEREPDGEGPAEQMVVQEAPGPLPPAPQDDDDDDEEEGSVLEVVEEGVKTSLVYFSDNTHVEKIKTILRQLDFYVSSAQNTKVALKKLHQNHYDLVVVDELSDQSGRAENLLLHHIQLLPMHLRRRFFLCLLSRALPTLDQMTAFRVGVDMTLNVRDLDKAKLILLRAMKDHSAFYQLFSRELEKRGQV